MVSEAGIEPLFQFQFSLIDQIGDELGIVKDIEIAAILLVFMLHGIVAMGAGGNDLFNVVVFENFNILFCHHLELKLVSCPSRRIATAGLGIAQYRKIDAGRFQHPRHCKGRLDIALDKGACATHPEKGVGAIPFRQYFNLQLTGPVPPQSHRLNSSPWVPPLLHISKHELSALRHLALLQHQVSPEVNDLTDMFDADRAHLLAGAASRASPDFLFADDIADHRPG